MSVGGSWARAAHQVLDPFHAVTYLASQAAAAFREAGLTGPWDGYFGGRTAPLGQVSPATVCAVFYHFKPVMVDTVMTGLAGKSTPEANLDARMAGVDDALRAHLVCASLGGQVAEAADLATRAAMACTIPARPLGAANLALPMPDETHLALWQASTTLREFRGDGHGIALAEADLDGVEALITAVGAGIERRASIQRRRGWTDDEWSAGEDRLRRRGLLTEEGALTETGTSLRQAVEDRTDELAAGPWTVLGDQKTSRLLELLGPLSARLTRGLRAEGEQRARRE
ncbi:SCO6745 family protein [Amycolatopsis japonica]